MSFQRHCSATKGCKTDENIYDRIYEDFRALLLHEVKYFWRQTADRCSSEQPIATCRLCKT